MIFSVKADPYQTDVVFAIAEDLPRINDYLLRVTKAKPSLLESVRENLNAGPRVQGRTLEFDNGAILIWLKEVPMGAKSMGLLCHEAYHAACMILRRVGMRDGAETEEAWAYLQQHLCEQAFRRIGKKHWK